jgi:hypothetical protein
MPITVSLKVVFQAVPELNRWAELMSLDWQSPEPSDAAVVPQPGAAAGVFGVATGPGMPAPAAAATAEALELHGAREPGPVANAVETPA